MAKEKMKTFYILIDIDTEITYGYTFDYNKALDEAKRIEDEECIAISVYEFSPEDMF